MYFKGPGLIRGLTVGLTRGLENGLLKGLLNGPRIPLLGCGMDIDNLFASSGVVCFMEASAPALATIAFLS